MKVWVAARISCLACRLLDDDSDAATQSSDGNTSGFELQFWDGARWTGEQRFEQLVNGEWFVWTNFSLWNRPLLGGGRLHASTVEEGHCKTSG